MAFEIYGEKIRETKLALAKEISESKRTLDSSLIKAINTTNSKIVEKQQNKES